MKKAFKISFVLLIVFVVAFGSLSAYLGYNLYEKNQYIADVKAQIEKNENEITDQEKLANELQEKLNKSAEENSTLKSQLEEAKAEKDRLTKENSELKSSIEKLKAQRKAEAQVAINATAPKGFINNNGAKVCYLTFDDGPSNNTLNILNILKRYNIKATFFVMNTDKIDYLKNIHDEGHTIGLHTFSHNYAHIYSSPTAFFDDLQKISDKVESITGVKSTITRFPGGSSNKVSKQYCNGVMTTLVGEVVKRGYSYFDWNVDSQDASGNNVSYTRIKDSIIGGSGNKQSICVLMHDSSAKGTTVTALPYIIEGLAAKGYRFEALTATSTGPNFRHGLNN